MKLVRTSFFSAIVTFIRIASGFIAGKVVAIITGPAGVATIGQFTNLITIILTFANGAINNGVVKYTAQFEGDISLQKKLFSTSLKITLWCSVLVGIALFVGTDILSAWIFKSNLFLNQIRVFGITIPLYAINLLLISIVNGKQQIKKFTIINTAGSLISLMVTLLLVYFYKLQGALYALVISQSLVVFVSLVILNKTDWFSWAYFKYRFDRNLSLKLSHYSLMAIVTALTVPVSQIILRNILISELGINYAGYWQGLMRISDGYLMIITTALSTYYLPKLASLRTDRELRQEILSGYRIILPATFFGCLLIYFLRFLIIRTLFTQSFVVMETLFFYQLTGDFLKIAAWVLSYLMLAKKMTKTFIITEILFSVTYVLIARACVNLFGFQGIALAFAVNYFIYFIAMTVIFGKLLFANSKRF